MIITRRPGQPIDNGTSVIIDLPHAAERPAHPSLCSLKNAATHEPINGVIGLSLHMDINAPFGGTWIVTEQLVDEKGAPLGPGVHPASQAHPEFFQPSVPTALFRYQVAGFTTGEAFDRTTGWHPTVAEQNERGKPRTNGPAFTVRLRSSGTTRVAAVHFESRDGFVIFYSLQNRAVAAFPVKDVVSVEDAPEGVVLGLADDAHLRTLRSAIAWELQRTEKAPGSGYREYLAKLAELLGVPQHDQAADDESDDGDEFGCNDGLDDDAEAQAEALTPCR